MFHLPYYEKFYHKIHVPIHHVLMIGYDDEKQLIYVLDCDRSNSQCIPFTDLERAWNINIPGLGKKNTFYTFELNNVVADVESIARNGLHKRARGMLNAPVSMLGLERDAQIGDRIAKLVKGSFGYTTRYFSAPFSRIYRVSAGSAQPTNRL
jgi:hypothetical protein